VRAVFVGHEIYRLRGYGGNHPLAIARVGPVMDLCLALGWPGNDAYRVSPRASAEQLTWFHTAAYVRALRWASATGQVDAATRGRHHLGTMENPLFPGLFERAATSVGGSILAAELALEGRIAYHPAGGTHHGRPDRASGFCYFNDPVFAILRLLQAAAAPVLYVDLDAHHGDGVQDAFASDERVLTVSIHEQDRWPHTGDVLDVGEGRACNLPVPPGFNDAELEALLEAVVLPLARRVAPEAVVITCGADALAGDPLSSMALSNTALWSAVERLTACARVAVVLGGGGYNPWTVARCWSGLWARLCGRPVPATLPAAARSILASLTCDLVDDEDIQDAWLTTLADARNEGAVRPAIRSLLERNHELA
jgi:acetoin utilization protein AcuC